MTESCSICKTDYEHISTDDDGDKHYKCSQGHFMVKTYRDDPDYDDLMDYWMGGGGYMPWQYQWTQQVILNQLSWKPIYWDQTKAFDPVWNKYYRRTSPITITGRTAIAPAGTVTFTMSADGTGARTEYEKWLDEPI